MNQYRLQCKGPHDTEWSTLNVRTIPLGETITETDERKSTLRELERFMAQWQQHPEFADHLFRLAKEKR